MRDDAREDAELVVAVRSGERQAFGELVERWFDRCWEVAWRILHDRELAAEVAQEVLFTAWRHLDRLEQPASFGGWVLRISRNRALDRLERERRTMSTGDEELLETAAPDGGSGAPDAEVERHARQDLVWAAAAALGERDSSLLDLHLRHGLEPAELASELGITPNAAHQALFRLRTRLGEAIRAWLLWRTGTPRCVVLRAELAAAGLETFDARVVRAVLRHAEACLACGEERERATAPAALFAAVPLAVVPTLVRAQAIEALRSAGVPAGSAAGSDGDAAGNTGRADAADQPDPGPDDTSDDDRRGTPWWIVAALILLIGLGSTTASWWPETAELAGPGSAEAATTEHAVEEDPSDPPSGEAGGPTDEPPDAPADPSGSVHIDGLTPDVDLPGVVADPTPAPEVPREAPGATSEQPPVRDPDPTDGEERPPAEEPPSTDEPPATEEPPSTEEPPATEEDPPEILRFAMVRAERCNHPSGGRAHWREMRWLIEGADRLLIDLGDGSGPQEVDEHPAPVACVLDGSTVELTAINAAGSVTASALAD